MTAKEMFEMRMNSHSRLALIPALIKRRDYAAPTRLLCGPNATFKLHATTCLVKEGAWRARPATLLPASPGPTSSICRDNDIPITLGDFELADVHGAARRSYRP